MNCKTEFLKDLCLRCKKVQKVLEFMEFDEEEATLSKISTTIEEVRLDNEVIK